MKRPTYRRVRSPGRSSPKLLFIFLLELPASKRERERAGLQQRFLVAERTSGCGGSCSRGASQFQPGLVAAADDDGALPRGGSARLHGVVAAVLRNSSQGQRAAQFDGVLPRGGRAERTSSPPARRRRRANPAKKSRGAGRPEPSRELEMLPWAATASPTTTPAAVSLVPLVRAAAPRTPPALYRPLPRPLCAGLKTPRRATSSNGEVFWEEPDDGSGSDYEEDREEEAERKRSSYFPSSSPFSRIEEARQQEQELRREIELLLTPEEKAILDQHETPDVIRISSPKWHPLHSYALALQIPLLDKLLDSGIDINTLDKDGFTPLHKAIIGKKEAVISHLLRKGANPHVRDRDGATPLHYAVQAGALQTVKLLIKYKVDVNVADNDGWTPLHLAIQSRNRDIAKVLLVNGADKTRRTKFDGFRNDDINMETLALPDGRTALDLSLCFGRDFKSYDLAKLVKLVPGNRGI
ncbi:hypothetical protein U9M48_029145 [Paspalum notatum var. saurae]|uniref:Ankyrin repeat domain-containing protein EMB506, chloroplastic n=2 Tax=Paspalum notatum var. saurae TaxID=547442 RepID=A0AAQ3U0C0_PASNO